MESEVDDDERSNTDVEEVEEMLYCSIYHGHLNPEENENGIIKQDHCTVATVEESKTHVSIQERSEEKEPIEDKWKDSSKEAMLVGLSSNSEDDSALECLGKVDGHTKKGAIDSDLCFKIPGQSTEMSEEIGCNTSGKMSSGVCINDLEDGEITDESDKSAEVQIVCEKRQENDLEDGELSSDESVKIDVPVVNLEAEESESAVLSETEGAIKTNFTINVKYSYQPEYDVLSQGSRCSDYESSVSGTEDLCSSTCPNLTATLDEVLPTDLCNSDSEISQNFSVVAIQETMPDCCWQISKEDRCLERKFITDDLIKCNICELNGHKTCDCPELLQPNSCQYCGRRGHQSPASLSHCPNAVCVLCWAPGHVEQQCPRQWIKKNVCDLCNNTGHTGMQCPHWWNGYYDKDESDSDNVVGKVTGSEQKGKQFCCNCGEQGHRYEDCNLPRPSYSGLWPFTDGSSDLEDQVKPKKVADSYVWSLNICPSEDNGAKVSEDTKLTFRDFLKDNPKFRLADGGRVKGKIKKGVKTFKNMLKEARLKRKRHKKHRRERRKLELLYGKVGQRKGDSLGAHGEQNGKEKHKTKRRYRMPIESEKLDGGQKVGHRHHRKQKVSLREPFVISGKYKSRRSRLFFL